MSAMRTACLMLVGVLLGASGKAQALDIAAFFTHQPRPPFAGAKTDYAGGKKPKDAVVELMRRDPRAERD